MHRLLRSGGAAALLVLALVGCSAANLHKRELVVHFSPQASEAEHLAALRACAHATPNATPEPVRHNPRFVASYVGDIRFRIDHASQRDIAQLETCLARQPGVVGFEDTAYND